MSKGVDVSVEWKIDQAAVDRLTKDPAGPTGQLVKATGAKARAKAEAGAPVDTGALRGSITQRDTTDSGEVAALIVVTAPYWHFVEFGTRYQRPRPFMRPAAQVTV
jgi:HK97 gp10 family phage protein